MAAFDEKFTIDDRKKMMAQAHPEERENIKYLVF